MKSVTVKYYTPKGNDLVLHEHTLHLKNEWPELEEKDILAFTELREMKDAQKIDDVQFMVALVCHFLNIDNKLFKKLRRAEIEFVFKHLLFLYEEPKIDKLLIKSFTIGEETFYGPDEDFNYCSISEYFSAENNYLQYMDGKDITFLDKMISQLYRPASELTVLKMDKRCSSEDYDADLFALKISKLPYHVKDAIQMNFRGMRNTLAELHPKIFAKRKDSDSTEQSYLSILLQLCGTTFGPLKETQKESVWPIMRYMEDAAIAREKLEAQIQKNKSKSTN